MKIVVTSDTHQQEPKLPDGDLLIHVGDWSGFGLKDETLKFIEWMKSVKPRFKHGIVVTPGNHERWVEKFEIEARNLFLDAGINLLINEHVTINGVCIYGSPLSLPFYDWAYMANETRTAAILKNIRPETQIIISHGPAKGLLDLVPRKENVGSQALLDVVNLIKPKYCFVGHIHQQGNQNLTIGETKYYNVAHGYRTESHHAPVVVEI